MIFAAANLLQTVYRRSAAPLALILLTALAVAPALGQETEPAAKPRPVADQTRVFRRSLHQLGFTPLTNFQELKPENTILVLLGDTRCLTDVPGGLAGFLQKGGAALIASDQPMEEKPKAILREAVGVTITGHTWKRAFNPRDCFHQIDFCPWMISNDPRFMKHPKTSVDLQVATNMPSTLDGKDLWKRLVRPFAYLPPGTWQSNEEEPNERPNRRRQRFEEDVDRILRGLPGDMPADDFLFGVAGEVRDGRALVLADHSIFIDEMMRFPSTENNNVEFAANCMAYLCGNHGQRTKVLFVEEGRPQPTFDLPTMPEPKLSKFDIVNNLLNHAQDQLNELDDHDAFNNKLLSYLGQSWHLTSARLMKITAIAAALTVLIYGCYRLGIASRHRHEAAVPPPPTALVPQPPGGSLLQLRHAGVLEANNVWEAGQQLARDAFEAGGVAMPAPYREPTVKVQGPWWRRFSARRRVRRLWRLAFRNQPNPLPPLAAAALSDELEELRDALKRGRIEVT